MAIILTTCLTYTVYRFYNVAARELKRLESVTKSPMLAYFAQMVSGGNLVLCHTCTYTRTYTVHNLT